MATLTSTVHAIILSDERARRDNRYLCIAVWKRFGLELRPEQIDAVGCCPPPGSVIREAQRLRATFRNLGRERRAR